MLHETMQIPSELREASRPVRNNSHRVEHHSQLGELFLILGDGSSSLNRFVPANPSSHPVLSTHWQEMNFITFPVFEEKINTPEVRDYFESLRLVPWSSQPDSPF